MPEIDPDAIEQIPPAAASTYAKLAAAYGQEYYRSVADAVAAVVGPGDRLLDAGTGPGLLPVAVANRHPDLQIDAFDFTHELVRYGRDQASRHGVADRVSFITADCYAIPVRDRTYPVLTCTGVLHSLEAPDAALAEFHRVLQPGGHALVFDPTVLSVPEDPRALDVELTDHEWDVYTAYGVQTPSDDPPISKGEAEALSERSPFEAGQVETGPQGDVRVTLERHD